MKNKYKQILKAKFGDRLLQVRSAEGGRYLRAYFWKAYKGATAAEIDCYNPGVIYLLLPAENFKAGWRRIGMENVS